MQNSERYDELIREFCFMSGIEETAGIGYGEVLSVGEYLVQIDYIEEIERCRVMVDLGEPDWDHETDFYKFMLQVDFDNASEFLPVLSLQPETNHVILSQYISLDILEDEVSLAELIRDHLPAAVEKWESLVKKYIEASDDFNQKEFGRLA